MSRLRTRKDRVAGSVAKRALDLVLALVLLVLTAPLFAVVALVIKIDSRGPVFYRCRRVGFRGREIAMLKFRKMHDGATGPALTAAEDDRFTDFGRFLARSKLDELPQLWNVLKGEMSFVGPRPEDMTFVAEHPEGYARILQVKPGMTGLCQLAFANEAAILDDGDRVGDYVSRVLPQKIALDTLYASRRSLYLDVRILLWTAVVVLAHWNLSVDWTSTRLSIRRTRGAARASVAGGAG
jgi:lipopolysaccharide/colanic/teichoic acid biosynthesis glycosyltransferase